jgi:hypothetical protein
MGFRVMPAPRLMGMVSLVTVASFDGRLDPVVAVLIVPAAAAARSRSG